MLWPLQLHCGQDCTGCWLQLTGRHYLIYKFFLWRRKSWSVSCCCVAQRLCEETHGWTLDWCIHPNETLNNKWPCGECTNPTLPVMQEEKVLKVLSTKTCDSRKHPSSQVSSSLIQPSELDCITPEDSALWIKPTILWCLCHTFSVLYIIQLAQQSAFLNSRGHQMWCRLRSLTQQSCGKPLLQED